MPKDKKSNRDVEKAGTDDNTVEMSRRGIITIDPDIMGGKPCIRGMRITVGSVVGHVASEESFDEIIKQYANLITKEDILAALEYASWRCQNLKINL